MEHKRLEEILKQELAWTLAQVRKAGCIIFYLGGSKNSFKFQIGEEENEEQLNSFTNKGFQDDEQ